MTDYIKREDAEGTIRYFFLVDNLFIDKGAEVRRLTNKEKYDEALKYIEHLSTADVAPVRHGRWFQDAIYYGEDGSPCIVDICTECGAYGYYADFNYCPNCGAKMYKENDND